MQPDQSDSFLRRNPAISARRSHEAEVILYNPDTGREKILNRTGAWIWQACDGITRIAELTARLASDFRIPSAEVVENDVRSFASVLISNAYALAMDKPLTTPDPVECYPSALDAPKEMDLSLTGKCNLKCHYCFYAREMADRHDLPTEDWILFLNELKSLGVRSLTLSGGEVFMRQDLWVLIDALISNRMRYSILSNGTVVTQRTVAELTTGRRRQRLNSIQISIDGSCAEVHDKSRGKGSFDKALRGLRMLKEAGLPVTARVTINRHNVGDLENVARLLLEDIGMPCFGTNDAMPMGSGCSNQGTIALTPSQQLEAMKTLARLVEKYNGRVSATAGPLAKWRSYQEMEHAKATGQKTSRWQMGRLTSCGGVFSKLAVNHDGVITPCNLLSTLNLGQINRDSLTTIWTSHPTLKALRERRNIPMNETPGCEDCEWAPYCNGGCPGLAYEMTSDFNRANPHDCYRRFLENTKDWRSGMPCC